jgi:hypothetical protein
VPPQKIPFATSLQYIDFNILILYHVMNMTAEIPFSQLPMKEDLLSADSERTAKYLATQFIESAMGTDNETGVLSEQRVSATQMRDILASLAAYLSPGEVALPASEFGSAYTTGDMKTVGPFMQRFIATAQDRLAQDTGTEITQRDMRPRVDDIPRK